MYLLETVVQSARLVTPLFQTVFNIDPPEGTSFTPQQSIAKHYKVRGALHWFLAGVSRLSFVYPTLQRMWIVQQTMMLVPGRICKFFQGNQNETAPKELWFLKVPRKKGSCVLFIFKETLNAIRKVQQMWIFENFDTAYYARIAVFCQ